MRTKTRMTWSHENFRTRLWIRENGYTRSLSRCTWLQQMRRLINWASSYRTGERFSKNQEPDTTWAEQTPQRDIFKDNDEGIFPEGPQEDAIKAKDQPHKQLTKPKSEAMTTQVISDNRHISFCEISTRSRFRKFRSSDSFNERISRIGDSSTFSYDQRSRYSHNLTTSIMKESRRLQAEMDILKAENRLVTK